MTAALKVLTLKAARHRVVNLILLHRIRHEHGLTVGDVNLVHTGFLFTAIVPL